MPAEGCAPGVGWAPGEAAPEGGRSCSIALPSAAATASAWELVITSFATSVSSSELTTVLGSPMGPPG